MRWVAVPDPSSSKVPARKQVPGYTIFRRGEGIFFDSGTVYLATTSDDRVYAYETASERLEVLYDGKALPDAPLHDVDNVATHPGSGDLFVCEDADDLQICLITGDREVAPFVQVTGAGTGGPGALQSELTGVTFDPSGRRMYFSSQRALGAGLTYEVTGPFRTLEPRRPPAVTPAPAPPLVLRAKPAARLATVRRDGLLATLEVPAAGRYDVRLRARSAGRSVTVARATRTVSRAGTVRIRLRTPASSRAEVAALRGRTIVAELVAVGPGGRRETRRCGSRAAVHGTLRVGWDRLTVTRIRRRSATRRTEERRRATNGCGHLAPRTAGAPATHLDSGAMPLRTADAPAFSLTAADRERLREHVETALRRARRHGEALAAVTVALGPDVDPSAVIAASRGAGEPWWCFEQPDREDSALAALGCAVALDADGPDRFRSVAARWRTLASTPPATRSTGPRGSGPVAVGGFSFAPQGSRAPHWAAFPAASMHVPEVAIVRRARRGPPDR